MSCDKLSLIVCHFDRSGEIFVPANYCEEAQYPLIVRHLDRSGEIFVHANSKERMLDYSKNIMSPLRGSFANV